MEFNLDFQDILNTDNIAELLSKDDLGLLGNHCFEMYEADYGSDPEYYERMERITKLLSPYLEPKNTPYQNSSNVNIPLVLNACIAYNARAYGILFRDDKVCYVKTEGDDSGLYQTTDPATGMPLPEPIEVVPEGAKRKRADRVANYMNYQLMYEDTNWERDTDKLELLKSAYGEMYRKRYYDPRTGKQCSEIIHPKNMIIHCDTVRFEDARKTVPFPLYPHDIKSRILNELYVDFEYIDDNTNEQHEFLEQDTRIDLDGDGYAEPYVVTIHSETRSVVRIVKNFDPELIEYIEEGKIGEIKADNYYIRYEFMPDPKGSFRGIGFGYLLLNINENVNTSFNQLNDAGKLSNTPAILAGRGIRMKGGKMPLKTGQMQFVDSTGRALRDDIYEINFPQPSSALFNLAQFLIGYGKELGGLKDALTGELRSDLPANTALAMIEQGMNEFKSIFKRTYLSMAQEFRLLYKLNSQYLSPLEYRDYGDNESYQVLEDFKQGDMNIVPVADFASLTSIEKQYKAMALREMAKEGLIAPSFVAKYSLEALGIGDVDEALDFEPSNQDKELQISVAKAQITEAQAKIMEQQNKSRELSIKEKKTNAEIAEKVAKVMDILERAEARNEGDMVDNALKELQFIREYIGQANDDRFNEGAVGGMASPGGNAASMAIPQGLQG